MWYAKSTTQTISEVNTWLSGDFWLIFSQFLQAEDRLVGLVVKASADPAGSIPACAEFFFFPGRVIPVTSKLAL